MTKRMNKTPCVVDLFQTWIGTAYVGAYYTEERMLKAVVYWAKQCGLQTYTAHVIHWQGEVWQYGDPVTEYVIFQEEIQHETDS